MYINPISCDCPSTKRISSNLNNNTAVSFGQKEEKSNNDALLLASLLAIAALGGSTASCTKIDTGEPIAWARAGVNVTPGDTTHYTVPRDTLYLPGQRDTIYVDRPGGGRDTIYIDRPINVHDTVYVDRPGGRDTVYITPFVRPIPLDSLLNNFHNWDIDGADSLDFRDPDAKRNIVHYEGIRDWEYAYKEVGDMSLLESSKNILVYNTEIFDYKGNHQRYGKHVLRFPTGNFTITQKDGTVLTNPKGLFLEEYDNEIDEKNASIMDCKLKERLFVQTNGDTLRVAKAADGRNFRATGVAAKGYLGNNSILLRDLIGNESTDDHFLDVKHEVIDDKELERRYVAAKVEEYLAEQNN